MRRSDEKKPQPDKDSSINNLFHAEYDNFVFELIRKLRNSFSTVYETV